MGVWVLAFECTIGCDYANEMACFSISRRTISRRGEDTKTGGSKLRIWGSGVRISSGAPLHRASLNKLHCSAAFTLSIAGHTGLEDAWDEACNALLTLSKFGFNAASPLFLTEGTSRSMFSESIWTC